MVNLDPDKLQAIRRIAGAGDLRGQHREVSLHRQAIFTTGTSTAWSAPTSTLGPDLAELMELRSIRSPGTNIYLRDIGNIENGTDIVTAYAHVDGRRTVYIPVTKRSDASTLAVIQAVKEAIPGFKKVIPDDVDVQLAFDQSGYVSNAIGGLVREAALELCSPALWCCSSCATGVER